MSVNSLPLRLLCLLIARERHIPSVLKELFAVPKLAESHSYLLIGSPQGSWETEGAPEAESSPPGTVCCCQWTAGLSLSAECLCAIFLLKEKL